MRSTLYCSIILFLLAGIWSCKKNEAPVYLSVEWWDLLSEAEETYYRDLKEMMEYDLDYKPETEPPEILVNKKMHGKFIKIPGYVVGMDADPDNFTKTSEFLFVPFQGACIHVPPPPENQTILVKMEESIDSDPYLPRILWGKIMVGEGKTDLAGYFYVMDGTKIEDYTPEKYEEYEEE